MKKLILFALALLPGLANAQTLPQSPIVKKWVTPDTVRYFYEISTKAHTFTVANEKVLGFPILKWEKIKGQIEIIGDNTYRYTRADGVKEVYRIQAQSRVIGVELPLEVYQCEGGACKGWLFVVPPFKTVEPKKPETKKNDDPPATRGKPPQVIETKRVKPRVLETRRPVVQYSIYRKGKR